MCTNVYVDSVYLKRTRAERKTVAALLAIADCKTAQGLVAVLVESQPVSRTSSSSAL